MSDFWFSGIFSFRLRYGGFMSGIVLLGLAVAGVYLLRRKAVAEAYLTAFMAATSLLFLVGDEAITSRLLYNVPVGLFTALGFASMGRWKVGGDLKGVTVLFVVLNSMVYLFQSSANLV